MSLVTFSFNDFVTQFQNALASGSPKFTNFSTGAAALALAEAAAGNAMSLQYVVQQLADVTRLATSSGADVDSFLADWGLTRVPAVPSSGTITITRNNTTVPLLIATDGSALVGTTYTGLQFALVADGNQPAYDPVQGGYFMNNGVSSITATVQCTTSGAVSNVLPNTVNKIVSGLNGVSTVNNAAGFTNGADRESDAEAKQRFTNFVSSLSKGNLAATNAAIAAVQPNLTWQIIEYKDFDGTTFPGYVVVADDGSGAIGSPLLAAILAACGSVRAAGIQVKTYAPTNVNVAVSVQLSYSAGSAQNVVNAAVQQAVQVVINGKGVGNTLHYADVSSVIQNTPGVIGYANLLLNGVTGTDVTILQTQLARFSTITFT